MLAHRTIGIHVGLSLLSPTWTAEVAHRRALPVVLPRRLGPLRGTYIDSYEQNDMISMVT